MISSTTREHGQREQSFLHEEGVLNMFDGVSNVGYNSAPAFVDVDNDGDMDLVIGRWEGDLKVMYDPSFCASCNNQGSCVYSSGAFTCDCNLDSFAGTYCHKCAPGYSESKFEPSYRGIQLRTPCTPCGNGYWNSAARRLLHPAPLVFSSKC